MSKKSKHGGLLRSLGQNLQKSIDHNRAVAPHRFVSAHDNILFVENVANKLGCSIDHVRRIPRDQLSAAKAGKRVIYLRENVETYVRNLNISYASNSSSPNLGEQTRPNEVGKFDPVKALLNDQS